MIIPTIKIENSEADRGFSVINETDFDPKKHTEFGKKKPVKKLVKKGK